MPLLAALPILLVILLMAVFRWSGQRAGPAGWLLGLIIAILFFGLSPQVFWISQARGLYLSLFVLAVLWPALLLFRLVDQVGGIQAIAHGLEQTIANRGLLLVGLAWGFSGMIEGLAGFGLPIAIVAPMLVGLGVNPIAAVAAVAVGHSWSVTFGDMGVIFQTLVTLARMDANVLAPAAAILLGVACLACGWAAMLVLSQSQEWLKITLLALLMAFIQYILAIIGLPQLAALGAGLAVMLVLLLATGFSKRRAKRSSSTTIDGARYTVSPLRCALGSYGSLTALMVALALIPGLHAAVAKIVWRFPFPETTTLLGFVAAANVNSVAPLLHPGASIALIAALSFAFYSHKGYLNGAKSRQVLLSTWNSAAPTSLSIFSMVGLSTLMDATGMTLTLAQALSHWIGLAYPLISPLIGILGAFATGSNNNSNVLFTSLQLNAALLLSLEPRWLVAAQTAGGALGSMIAPAKIVVGCSTVGIKDQHGEVMRLTLPFSLFIGLLLGLAAWIFLSLL